MPWPNYTLGPGKDYESMLLAEAAIQSDWGTNNGDSPVTLTCDAFVDSGSNVTWVGYSPAPTAVNNISIRPAVGAEHNGVRNTGYRLECSASNFGNGFLAQLPYMSIEGISIKQSNPSGNLVNVVSVSAADVTLDKLILENASTLTTTFISAGSGAPDLTVRNCLLDGAGSASTTGISSPSDRAGLIDNVTCVNLGTGFGFTGGNPLVTHRNSVAFNCSTEGFKAGFPGGENNASDDGTAQGTSPFQSVVAGDFVDHQTDGTGDYNIAPGGNLDGANNPGVDLSGTFTDDIAGNLRSVPWERGAYEIAAVASPNPTTSTIGADKDYTTGDTWESNEQRDLVALDEQETVIVDAGYDLVGTFNVADWGDRVTGTDATRFIKIVGAVPHGGVYKDDGGPGAWCTRLSIAQNYVYCEDIEVFRNDTITNVNATTANTNVFFDKVISTNFSTASGNQNWSFTSADGHVRNCLIRTSGRAIDARGGVDTVLIQYTTAISVGTHIFLGGICTNNVAFSTTGSGVGFHDPEGGDYNAATDASAPGANSVDNIDSTAFEDYANNNYTPAVGGVLEDAGVAIPGITEDVTGFTRGDPPEIGAFEIQVAPGAPVLSAPTQTNIGQTQADIGCTTDTAGGTLYWYVSTSATPPSAADLKAGTGAVSFGNFTPILGANSVTATGLTENTEYWHHWIQDG